MATTPPDLTNRKLAQRGRDFPGPNVTAETSIEELLANLELFGRIQSIHHFDDNTWRATMDVPTDLPALLAKIKSDYMPSLRDALADLLRKCHRE